MKQILLHHASTNNKGRSNTRIMIMMLHCLVAAMLVVPAASAQLLGTVVDTVEGTVDSTLETADEILPGASVETEPVAEPLILFMPAEPEPAPAYATPGAIHTIETVSWWPIWIALAILALAVAIVHVRRPVPKAEALEAGPERAEVIWKQEPKTETQTQSEAPRSDAMAALERDLATPTTSARPVAA